MNKHINTLNVCTLYLTKALGFQSHLIFNTDPSAILKPFLKTCSGLGLESFYLFIVFAQKQQHLVAFKTNKKRFDLTGFFAR